MRRERRGEAVVRVGGRPCRPGLVAAVQPVRGRDPILSLDAGGVTVAVCIAGREAGARAVEFARELAVSASVFAAEVERVHAGQAAAKAAGGEAA